MTAVVHVPSSTAYCVRVLRTVCTVQHGQGGHRVAGCCPAVGRLNRLKSAAARAASAQLCAVEAARIADDTERGAGVLRTRPVGGPGAPRAARGVRMGSCWLRPSRLRCQRRQCQQHHAPWCWHGSTMRLPLAPADAERMRTRPAPTVWGCLPGRQCQYSAAGAVVLA
jgi:hypothetical protein